MPIVSVVGVNLTSLKRLTGVRKEGFAKERWHRPHRYPQDKDQRSMSYEGHNHTTVDAGSRPFMGARLAENYDESIDAATELVDDSESTDATEITTVSPQAAGRHADSFVEIGKLGTAPTKAKATQGLRGALGKFGIILAPSAAESARLTLAQSVADDEEIIRQATWTRAVSVLVANPKGGVGKTPSALLIGGILSSVRGGSVCILEVADDAGSLAYRAEGDPKRGLGELVRDIEAIATAGQLAGYTAPQTSFASVIGTVGNRSRLTARDVVAVSSVIDQFYAIRVMDSGNQPSSAAFGGALEKADALVIPIYNAGDAAQEAIALIDAVRRVDADLADRAIVLRLSDGRPENDQVAERVTQLIQNAGVTEIIDIPYDTHIAERGQLTLGRIGEPTRRAFTAASAAIIRSLHAAIR